MIKWKKIVVLLCITVSLGFNLAAQQATWIWYPGDFEISLSNQMQNRRTDRGAMSPLFWKMESHYPLVNFHKKIDLNEQEEISVAAEGKYSIRLDNATIEFSPEKLMIPAGKHTIDIHVYNQANVPSIFVQG